MAKSYVDDVRWVLDAITRGLRYQHEAGVLIYDPTYEEMYSHLDEHEYTSKILLEIMNSFHHDMTFTCEHELQFDDGYLPTLDCKLRVNKPDNSHPNIEYLFYKKPVSSKLGIVQTSALPENTKRSTIAQDVIRRLSNTSRNVSREVKNMIINEYTSQLERSGYSRE